MPDTTLFETGGFKLTASDDHTGVRFNSAFAVGLDREQAIQLADAIIAWATPKVETE